MSINFSKYLIESIIIFLFLICLGGISFILNEISMLPILDCSFSDAEHILCTTPFMKETCNACINFMYAMSHNFHISYESINVFLFILLEPFAILCYAVSSILLLFKNSIYENKTSLIFFGMGSIALIIIIFSILSTFWYIMTL